MTNAQIQAAVESSAASGHPLNWSEAGDYLGSKEFLVTHPEDENAKATVAEFSAYLTKGKPMTRFSLFLLPIFYSDESIAHSDKLRDEYLAAKGKS
jgi:hypothetical protein